MACMVRCNKPLVHPYRKTSSYASVRYIESGTFSVSGLSAVLATLVRTCIFCFIYSLNLKKKVKKKKMYVCVSPQGLFLQKRGLVLTVCAFSVA